MKENLDLVHDAILSGYFTSFDISIYTGLKKSQVNGPLHVLENRKLISRVGYEKIHKYIHVVWGVYDPYITDKMIYENSAENVVPPKVMVPIREKQMIIENEPFSQNENHYGRFADLSRYTWEQVQAEAKAIEYKEGNYINELNFIRE